VFFFRFIQRASHMGHMWRVQIYYILTINGVIFENGGNKLLEVKCISMVSTTTFLILRIKERVKIKIVYWSSSIVSSISVILTFRRLMSTIVDVPHH
jgi:hypothetical protein